MRHYVMEQTIAILDYSPEYQPAIRKILTRTGWAEQYISAMESAVDVFAKDRETYGGYLVLLNGEAVGYLYVQYYACVNLPNLVPIISRQL